MDTFDDVHPRIGREILYHGMAMHHATRTHDGGELVCTACFSWASRGIHEESWTISAARFYRTAMPSRNFELSRIFIPRTREEMRLQS